MQRKASAVWKGGLKDGKGAVSSASGVLNSTPYSFSTRFENTAGTNPEELVAAAHAGCFAMKLSFVLQEGGFNPTELNVTCAINFENGAITESHLTLKGNVPGITKEKFDAAAADAKANCPISKLLNTNITMEASLA